MRLSAVPELPAGQFQPPLSADSPCVVRSGAPWATRFTLDHLREHYGALALRVTERDGTGDMFTTPDGPTREGTCSLSEYLDYLVDGALPEDRESSYYVEQPIRAFSSALGASLPDWCTGAHSSVMLIAAAQVASGLHIDRFDGHSLQLVGDKRWLLFPPDQGPLLGQVTWHCAVNPDQPDLAAYPRFAEARGLETVLSPGDVMYFPTGWFHKVRNLSKVAVSMSFFFEPPFGRGRAIPPSIRRADSAGPSRNMG